MNVCRVHAVMEVAVWTRTIVFIVCALKKQEEAFVKMVCNRVHALFHCMINCTFFIQVTC